MIPWTPRKQAHPQTQVEVAQTRAHPFMVEMVSWTDAACDLSNIVEQKNVRYSTSISSDSKHPILASAFTKETRSVSAKRVDKARSRADTVKGSRIGFVENVLSMVLQTAQTDDTRLTLDGSGSGASVVLPGDARSIPRWYRIHWSCSYAGTIR